MIKYIVRDMMAALGYLPYGLIAGILIFLLLGVLNKFRLKRQKKPVMRSVPSAGKKS